MNPLNPALNTATSWHGYAAIAVGVAVLIGLPIGGVIYGLASARGRQRKRLVVVVLITALVYLGLLFAANLWNYTHRRLGPSHAPGTTTSGRPAAAQADRGLGPPASPASLSSVPLLSWAVR